MTMPEFNPQKLASLRNTLADFQKRPLREASEALLSALGYKSDKTADFGSKPEQFIAAVEDATHSTFNRDKAHVSRWKQCAFLFQLTNDEIPSLAMGQQAFSNDNKPDTGGLGEKGKSDLGQRLLYEGQRESGEDVEYWKGEDISKFYISPTTSRFVRTSTTTSLLANERVVLNREYFSRTPKLIWRQTASCLIATVDDKGVWFGRSIQGATVRHNFRHLDFYFLAGVLNSAYLRYVYNRRVQEQGRIFPQVKFENIKPLPLVVVAKSEQNKIIQLVREAVSAKRTNPVVDISDLESQIDLEVYRLNGLTPEGGNKERGRVRTVAQSPQTNHARD